MFQSPVNKVIVSVTTKYIKNFTSVLRMSAIQQGSTIDPSDYVQIVGRVESVPKSISTDRREYVGFTQKGIRVGDTAIFSYSVIATTVQTEPEAEPIFKNLIWYKGQEYFAVNITELFAVIRDGEILMQNGFVMLENLEKPPIIILSQKDKRLTSAASAIVSNVGKMRHVERGDRVYFNPTRLQNYQINGKPFGIIREKDILGKNVSRYEEIATLN